MNDNIGITIEDIFILVDSCALYPPQFQDKNAMEQLWNLERAGKINKLEITDGTEEEMKKAPPWLSNRIKDRIISCNAVSNTDELLIFKEIKAMLFPQKIQLTKSDRIDVLNIFNAQKYKEFHYFVTCDKKHILSRAEIIRKRFRVRAVTPSNCLQEITYLIR